MSIRIIIICVIVFVFSGIVIADDPNELNYKPGELIVRFAPKANGKQRTKAERKGLLDSIDGGSIKHSFKRVPGLTVVKLPEKSKVKDKIKTFKNKKGILYAEPNYKIKLLSTIPDDTYFDNLWGMHNTGQTSGTADADIDAPQAWDIATDAKDVVVAVLDTGIDYNHEDLAANIWTNQAELNGTTGVDDDGNGYIDDIYGYDFSGYSEADQDNDPSDPDGHGTHVAGTIGAVGNNNIGVAGVCWNVKIMPVRIIYPPYFVSEWAAVVSNAIEGIEYAIDNGAKIMNASWGIGTNYSQSLKDYIQYAGDNGVLFVASAGNDNSQTIEYPAGYNLDNIITVMSTDHDDNKSSFSNYNSVSVDLAAPGSGIYSCVPNDLYTYGSGTSMAAPHVAGACALVWSVNPMLSHLEVKDIILNTVDPLPDFDDYCVTGGRLNLYNAVASVSNPPIHKVDNVDDAGYAEPNDYITYTMLYGNLITDPCAPGYVGTVNDVNIIDELPDEVDFDSASGNYQLDVNTVTWNIGTLSPGHAGSVTLTVQIKESTQLGSIITNCSLLTGDGIDYTSSCETMPVLPDVTGMYVCDAISEIEGIDNVTYRVSIYQYSDTVSTDYVIGQSVVGGVIYGTVVDLVVSLGPLADPNSNLLGNPSFENPNPCEDSWTDPCAPEPEYWQFQKNGDPDDSNICYITPAHPDYYAAEPAKHGDDYVQLRLVAEAPAGVETYVIQRQYVAEGINYQAQAYARSWDTEREAMLRLNFKDTNGNILRQDISTVSLPVPDDAEWTAIAIDSNGPAPVGTRIISVSVANLTPNTWVDYDLITLEHTEDRELTDCQLAQFNWTFEFFAGDFNRDCTVDMHDYSQLADQWLNQSIGCFADISPAPNGDGIVNFRDFARLAENWLWLWTPDGIQERMLAGGGGMEDLYFASSSSQAEQVQTLTDELEGSMTEASYGTLADFDIQISGGTLTVVGLNAVSLNYGIYDETAPLGTFSSPVILGDGSGGNAAGALRGIALYSDAVCSGFDFMTGDTTPSIDIVDVTDWFTVQYDGTPQYNGAFYYYAFNVYDYNGGGEVLIGTKIIPIIPE